MMIGGKDAIQVKMPKLVKDADVIHINERPRLLSLIGAKPEDYQDKQIIYHAHGSRFRRNYPKYLTMLFKDLPQSKIIVSSPDLIRSTFEATWFPAVIPIEKYYEKYPIQQNDPPVVYSAHTRPRRYRHHVIKVTDQLKEEGLNFEVKWIYRKTHHVNLTLKSQADIYFDGLRPMFGVNALEASCFKMPVVGSATQSAKDYIESLGVKCPYLDPYLNSFDKQKDELRRLINDKSYRAQRGEAGFQYVKTMHSPEVCVKRFLEMIE